MENQFNSVLCTNLLRLRTLNRYSQKRISEVIEVTQTSYNRMESGKIRISTYKLYQLAVFYRVQIEDLIVGNLSEMTHEQSFTSDLTRIKEMVDGLFAAAKKDDHFIVD